MALPAVGIAVTTLVIIGLEWVAVIIGTIAIASQIKLPSFSSKNREHHSSAPTLSSQLSPMPDAPVEPQPIVSSEFRLYRITEVNRTKAALLANGSILIVGEEGSGKSVLCNAVVESLLAESFTVASIEPATPKQMLLEIASQLGVDNQSLEGKVLSADQLKRAIATHFDQNTAFLVIDDAQLLDTKFRQWLKILKRSKVPMLICATDPPRSDIFTSIPRIELAQLPEYAIREIMEQSALERGINLKNSDLAKLQERAGGNPALAQRAIEEEYLGLEVEGADHRRYADATPLILLAGVGFVVTRFFARGTNNQALYIFSGIAAVNHLLISAAATSLILGTASPAIIAVGAIAGLFPDIDISSSPVGKVLPWISSFFEKNMPHRSCTHSLLASVIVGSCAYGVNYLTGDRFPNLASAITIGYFFGWFADMFTRSGVEMFFPSRVRWVCPGNRNLRLRTGSNTEYFILVLLTVVALLIFNLNNSGGLLTQFNRLIGGTSGVEQIYNESGSNHLIIAHIEGVRLMDRSRIDGDFLVIQSDGKGFIVRSKSGEIYKVGSDPDCQILSDRITADKSQAAVTTIETIFLEDEEAKLKQIRSEYDQQRSAFESSRAKLDSSGIEQQQELQQLTLSVRLAESELELANSKLATSREKRRLLEYDASVESLKRSQYQQQLEQEHSRQQQQYAENLRDRDYQLAQLNISLTNIDDRLAQIPLLRSPREGYIKRIKPWVGNNGKYSTTITIASNLSSKNEGTNVPNP